MKKKFSLWFNIVTICLCVCAIAIGVYAATSATLTVQGQIGFTAHNCNVDISGYIYGHAQGDVENGNPVTVPSGENDKIKLQAGTNGDTDTSTPYIAEIRGGAGSLKIGKRYFSDMESTDGKPADIVIVITATNVSDFDIEAEVGTITTPSTAVKATVVASITDSISKNQNITFTITLSMQKTGDTYSKIEMPTDQADDNLSIPITFKKSEIYTVTINYSTYEGYKSSGSATVLIDQKFPSGIKNLVNNGQIVVKVKKNLCITIPGSLYEYLHISTSSQTYSKININLGDHMPEWQSEVISITSNVIFTIEITKTQNT